MESSPSLQWVMTRPLKCLPLLRLFAFAIHHLRSVSVNAGSSRGGNGGEHVAIVHADPPDLTRRLAPSLRRAAAENAAVLVCVDDAVAARITEEFGTAAASFDFIPAAVRYDTPGTAMRALDDYVVAALAKGAPSAWSIGSVPLLRDGFDGRWMRYEAAVADVFAGRPLRAVCLYDAAATPEELRHDISAAHDSIDGQWASPAPVASNIRSLWPTRSPDLEMRHPTSRQVRVAVAELFDGLVSADTAHDICLVTIELATNASRHGAPPTLVRFWRDGRSCVVQVRDAGRTPLDPYADLRPRKGGPHGGFGLSIVGRLAHAVDIQHDADGNTVTALLTSR